MTNHDHSVRLFFSLIIFLVSSIGLMGQNLLPNPGFEICDNCNNRGQVELEVGGNGANTPPDWRAATYGTSDIRSDMPRSGQRHGGFFAGTKYEYLYNEFTSELEALTIYEMSFYIRSDGSPYFVDEIGVYFSVDEPQYFIFTVLDVVEPQFTTDDGDFIRDKEWREIKFEYLACGGEQFCTIGRFKELTKGDTLANTGGQLISYQVVDDFVFIQSKQSELIIPDTLEICGDTIMTLAVALDTSMFFISVNGEKNTSPFLLNKAGWNEIEVECKSTGKTRVDSVFIIIPEVPLFDLREDTMLCLGDSILLEVLDLADVQYEWSTGETSESIWVTSPGTYDLEITDVCGSTRSDTVEILPNTITIDKKKLFPNAITPNGDGINDVFRPNPDIVSVINIISFQLKVYNRWGQSIAEASNPEEGWAPKDDNQEVYFYTVSMVYNGCSGDQLLMLNGDVTLLR